MPTFANCSSSFKHPIHHHCFNAGDITMILKLKPKNQHHPAVPSRNGSRFNVRKSSSHEKIAANWGGSTNLQCYAITTTKNPYQIPHWITSLFKKNDDVLMFRIETLKFHHHPHLFCNVLFQKKSLT